MEIIKKLEEHFKRENESAVRVKILSLFGDIGCEPGVDIQVGVYAYQLSIVICSLSILSNTFSWLDSSCWNKLNNY